MADCQGGCTVQCAGDCSEFCASNCHDTCSGGCRTGCTDACSGCTGCTGCTGDCKGACYGCSSCSAECDGTCVEDCRSGCKETCDYDCLATCQNQCKGYCSNICQTYCETQQTFSLNTGYTSAVGTGQFGWSSNVASGETILISASDWNILKGYIQKACQYCGGTSPSQGDASSGDIITEDRYNDLADGINVSNVSGGPDGTIISADIMNTLVSKFNSRQIISDKPAGQYTGGQGQCCQNKQVCMESGQLLDHQKCKIQTVTKCGNQIPGKQYGS